MRQAVAQGDARAQYELGECYASGQGVAKDSAEAVKLYHGAAAQKEAMALYRLGECYWNGEGVEKDLDEAVAFYNMASEQFLAEGAPRLAEHVQEFVASLREREEAVRSLFEEQYKLGLRYEACGGKYAVKAAKSYRQSALGGYVPAQYKIGICYLRGEGVKKNMSKAIKWLRQAAAQGHAEAQARLDELS